MSRGCASCGRALLEEKANIAGKDLLTPRTEGANVRNEVTHDLARTDLLRIVGGENDARGRDLDQRGFHGSDRPAEAGGVEHQVVREIVVEVVRRLQAVTRISGGAPELLVLIAADATQHRRDAAAEMRHMHGQLRMTIEHAGVDQPDRRHDQREFASDRARGVVAVELLRMVELERRVYEHEHAEAGGFGPERLELRRVEEQAFGFRRDDHAGKPELVAAAGELAGRGGAAERMRVRGADEAAGVVALGLARRIVAEARTLEVGAHAGGARQQGRIDPGEVHHPDVLVEIVEEAVNRVAWRAAFVVVHDETVAGILLDQLARGEVVLEVDDHGGQIRVASSTTLPMPDRAATISCASTACESGSTRSMTAAKRPLAAASRLIFTSSGVSPVAPMMAIWL